ISFLILIYFFCLMQGCGKKWKETAEVDFNFELEEESGGYLSFDGGHIYIDQITFSGQRKQGKDVDFNRKFSEGEDKGIFSSLLTFVSFDIPQGTYTNIDIEIKTKTPSNESSILLTGTYLNNQGNRIPIRFEFNTPEIFSIKAETADGGSEIVLIESKPATASTIFDPFFWFNTVQKNQFEGASTTDIDGISTIVINNSLNLDIFNLVNDRVNKATKTVIK
ncbi:hypothetical protein JYT51_02485, partial [Candidatus Amoebophilus asiaticus]|nr:hypothetical protein [Candidatus Amoebophilus asiaticus]